MSARPSAPPTPLVYLPRASYRAPTFNYSHLTGNYACVMPTVPMKPPPSLGNRLLMSVRRCSPSTKSDVAPLRSTQSIEFQTKIDANCVPNRRRNRLSVAAAIERAPTHEAGSRLKASFASLPGKNRTHRQTMKRFLFRYFVHANSLAGVSGNQCHVQRSLSNYIRRITECTVRFLRRRLSIGGALSLVSRAQQ